MHDDDTHLDAFCCTDPLLLVLVSLVLVVCLLGILWVRMVMGMDSSTSIGLMLNALTSLGTGSEGSVIKTWKFLRPRRT